MDAIISDSVLVSSLASVLSDQVEHTVSSVRSFQSRVDDINAEVKRDEQNEELKTISNDCNNTRDEMPEGTWFTIIKPEPEVDGGFVPSEQIASTTDSTLTTVSPSEAVSELAKLFCPICGSRFDGILSLNKHLSLTDDPLHRHYNYQVYQVPPLPARAVSNNGDMPDQQSNHQKVIAAGGNGTHNEKNHSIQLQIENNQLRSQNVTKSFLSSQVGTSPDVLAACHNQNHKSEGCHKEFKSASELATHSSDHSRMFKCDVCEKELTRSTDLKKHILKSHSKNYQCEICQLQCLSSGGLSNHMQTHKRGEEAPQKCDICQREVRTRSGLISHMRMHKDEAKIHSCKVCRREFPTSFGLAKHMRSHEQQRPSRCSLCDRVFETATGLTMHMLHHSNAPEESHHCTICKKEYRTLTGLRIHMNMHEGRETTNNLLSSSSITSVQPNKTS